MAERPYREQQHVFPEYPEIVEYTPREVLIILVDLNERYGGKFECAINEMHVAIDQLWQAEIS